MMEGILMRFIIGFAVVLVLLVGGLLVAPSFINWDKYKAQGLTQVKAVTGYDITIDGAFKIGFLPAPHVSAKNVKVVNPSVSAEPLASFDELSVGVAVAPLLKKQVQVSNINLVKPVFDVRIDREGKGNWLSPEVEALLAKKDSEASDKPAASGGAAQNIGFDNVSIEDGRFRFFDAGKGKETLVEEINIDVSAKSLQGPFDAKGKLAFGGQPVAFDVEADAIDDAAGVIPLRLSAQYGAYEFALKGVAGIVAPFDVQGATQIKLNASSLPISENVQIEGLLSASQERVEIKDAQVVVGSSKFQGQTLVDVKPLNVKAAFEGSDVIDLGKFIPASDGSEKQADPLLMLTEILPKSVTLPQDFTADVSLKTGGLLYDKALLKATQVQLSKKGKEFKVSLKADDIPGNGPASVDGDLTFASSSQSKTGAQVYSDPTLNFTVQANTQNTGNMVKAFTGQSAIPVLSTTRIGKFYIKGQAKPGRFALSDSVVNLDDLKVSMDGSVKQGDAKPVIDFNVSSSISDPYAFAKTMKIDSSSWPKNLGAIIVGTDFKGSMDDLSVDAKVNAFGADFSVGGKLDELMSGSALNNLAIRVQHPNLKALLAKVGAGAPSFTAVSKPIDLSAVVKKDGDVVSFNNIKAKILGSTMDGSLRYDGSSSKAGLSGQLKFGSLSLQSSNASSKGAGGSSKSSSKSGKWSDAPMDNGWLHAMNADFDISADRLIYETWDMSKPSLKVSMQNGALNIKDLRAGMFSGQIALQSKVSSSAPTAPLSVAASSTISNVNIGQLAKALSGSNKLDGDGVVSLRMDLSGNGSSQKALVNTLAGSAVLDGKNVALKGFNLSGLASALLESNKPLARVQQLVNGASSGGETAFDTIEGDYTISKGIVTINSMKLDGPEALIVSTGSANLPLWSIDTTHNVTLKNAESVDPFDVTISGPLNNPANTFGRGIFDTYLNEKLGAKINDLIGDELGDGVANTLQQFGILPTQKKTTPANDNAEPTSEEKTPEEQAQEAIGNVLKGLF